MAPQQSAEDIALLFVLAEIFNASCLASGVRQDAPAPCPASQS